jgi:hypothetical protein
LPVQPHFQKYFYSLLTQITGLFHAVTSPGGRIAIVTDAGWDAVDAKALLTNSAGRGRRSRVVLTPRCWRQVARNFSRDDGGKKPVTGESTK